MNGDPASEMHKRLETLEAELGRFEVEHSVHEDHRQEARALRDRAQALRRRLQQEAAAGRAPGSELHAEWEALMNAFDRWAERVDRRFVSR